MDIPSLLPPSSDRLQSPSSCIDQSLLSCSPPAPRQSAPQGREPSLSGALPCPLAHRRCSLSIYQMWRRVRKPRALLLSGGPWARHVILPSVDASPVSGAVALAGHAVPKSCEGITPDVCCAPTVCRCSVPECSPRGKRERGRAVKIALSVTSTAGRARMLWGHGHQVGPLPSSTVALVTPTLLSLLTLRKYSEKEIRRLGGLPSEMQPQLCTLS